MKLSAVVGTAGWKSPQALRATPGSKSAKKVDEPAHRLAARKRGLRVLQAAEPRLVVRHVAPALARQQVAVGLQALNRFVGRERLGRRLGVEGRDHAAQLIDRAGEPLAVLLREFRHLRRRQTAQNPDRERKPAQQRLPSELLDS